MRRPDTFVDLGREIGPYSYYRAPGCVEGTLHPDLSGERRRQQDAPLGNHSKDSVNAEWHRSGLVIVAALFKGKALRSFMSAPIEAPKAFLHS